MRKTVVIGFVGTQLDNAGKGPSRWERWRPSVALCQHEDLLVHRFELLCGSTHQGLVKAVAADIGVVSPETTVRPVPLDVKDPWDFEEMYGALLDYARAYPFDPDNEDYLLHITTGTHVAQICMFLLTEARYFPARLLQTSPPRRQKGETTGIYEIIDLDLSKYNQIAARFQREQEESVSFLKSGIATRNAAFNKMIESIERVAVRSRAPVLFIGPTGAGKSFLARRVFALKKARHQLAGEFVEVNCATIRGESAMSALFGHVKGAFTGATSDRAGLLRKADKGLIFLDEIGELGLDEQAMLLKAIEEKRFFPFGGDREVTSDFQLIAGTNSDLRDDVKAGRFREDLFARVNLWTFFLPSLIERGEDIEPNLEYELTRFAQENTVTVRFNKEAKEKYLAFATSPTALWVGNFRELSASVTRMATLADGGRISVTVVDEEIVRLKMLWHAEPQSPLSDVLRMVRSAEVDLFDQLQLAEVIKVCRSSKSLADAGRKLFSTSMAKRRSANDTDRLRKYLARFGLDWRSVTDTEQRPILDSTRSYV